MCNGTDIVKVTFRLTVGDLIDNEAVAKYNELKPDLVTLDITMPNKDGIQALKEI